MFQFIGKRRPSVKGWIIGGTTGVIVAAAYGATAGWLCSGIRGCPASWEPYALVSSIIFVAITITGVIAGFVGAKLYKIFDTALDNEGGFTTFPPVGANGGSTLSGDGGGAAFAERPKSDG